MFLTVRKLLYVENVEVQKYDICPDCNDMQLENNYNSSIFVNKWLILLLGFVDMQKLHNYLLC
jgi:hypothetical protein